MQRSFLINSIFLHYYSCVNPQCLHDSVFMQVNNLLSHNNVIFLGAT
jgi:hypothetical protein